MASTPLEGATVIIAPPPFYSRNLNTTFKILQKNLILTVFTGITINPIVRTKLYIYSNAIAMILFEKDLALFILLLGHLILSFSFYMVNYLCLFLVLDKTFKGISLK